MTATEIKVGQVTTVGGPVPGLFKGAQLGTQAWVTYLNSQGGVCGRRIALTVKDDGFDAAQNKAAYQSLSGQVFALVGSFSVVSDGGFEVVEQTKVPDIAQVLGQKPYSLPTVFSPQPIPPGWYSGGLVYFKNRFPEAVTKMAYIVGNAKQALDAAAAQKAVAKQLGYTFVYEKTLEPVETGYDQYAQGMKSAGAKGLLMSFDAATQANIAKALKAQNYPLQMPGYGASAYDTAFLSLAGEAANGAVLEVPMAMYGGEDSSLVPEVGLLNKWYRAVGGKVPDLYATYGWGSGRLFEQALRTVGAPLTRPALVGALNNVHDFSANGLFPPQDVGGRKGSPCFLVVEVKAGRFVRSSDNPTGFRCNDGPFVAL